MLAAPLRRCLAQHLTLQLRVKVPRNTHIYELTPLSDKLPVLCKAHLPNILIPILPHETLAKGGDIHDDALLARRGDTFDHVIDDDFEGGEDCAHRGETLGGGGVGLRR